MIDYIQEVCCHDGCGIVFFLHQSHKNILLKTKANFYCPNGHGQHYTHNEEDRLRKIIESKNSEVTQLKIEIETIKKNKCKKHGKKTKRRS